MTTRQPVRRSNTRANARRFWKLSGKMCKYFLRKPRSISGFVAAKHAFRCMLCKAARPCAVSCCTQILEQSNHDAIVLMISVPRIQRPFLHKRPRMPQQRDHQCPALLRLHWQKTEFLYEQQAVLKQWLIQGFVVHRGCTRSFSHSPNVASACETGIAANRQTKLGQAMARSVSRSA